MFASCFFNSGIRMWCRNCRFVIDRSHEEGGQKLSKCVIKLSTSHCRVYLHFHLSIQLLDANDTDLCTYSYQNLRFPSNSSGA